MTFGRSIPSGAAFRLSRKARTFVASKLVLCVNCAISARLSCMVFAIMRRRFGSLISSYSCALTAAGAVVPAGAVAATASSCAAARAAKPPPKRPSFASASTSRSITLPCGPVGAACAGSTPSFSAAFFARGETPSARAAVAAATGAGSTAGAVVASAAAGAAVAAPSGANSENDSPGLPITATFNKTGTSSSAL
ncbi:hypothetical protein SDC9_193587 [bioreactor metagenome]|uniref:Uncharacterized protein n=1 Tax=bioreactor metagenome TaxID=1076179 RepID=A0A645I431_9ZZZZ